MMDIVDQESLREYKKKFNFFETPEKIGEKMGFFLQEMGRGVRILEPSAGRGALIKIIDRHATFSPQIDFCEIQKDFCDELTTYNKVGEDFIEYTPGGIYDAVIMNPPYKNGLAKKHTDHAWDCLKPGGRLIVLVDRGCAEYLDEEYMGHIFSREKIEKGFSETQIDTYLFFIIKPMY
jgi:hypothetical protein